jgi:hypothetical protein
MGEWIKNKPSKSAPTHGNKSGIIHEGSGLRYVEQLYPTPEIGLKAVNQVPLREQQTESPNPQVHLQAVHGVGLFYCLGAIM